MKYNTIVLKNFLNIFWEYTSTAVAVTPGALLELTSGGLVQVHSTEGGVILPMVATRDELQGKEISDNHPVSSKIQCWIPQRGDEAYLLVADDEVVSTGDFLISAGNGKVKVFDADDFSGTDLHNGIVGVALDALDMTDSEDAEIGRVPVRII